jgi:hypothetical protein
MKRKCIGIIMAVLIVVFIAMFSMIGCRNTINAKSAATNAPAATTKAPVATTAATTS